jgi:hypothetical protein
VVAHFVVSMDSLNVQNLIVFPGNRICTSPSFVIAVLPAMATATIAKSVSALRLPEKLSRRSRIRRKTVKEAISAISAATHSSVSLYRLLRRCTQGQACPQCHRWRDDSIPIIGFVISAIIKRADPTWISLGPVYPSSKRNPARNAVFVPSRLEDRPS